jgi:hypothetical protein
LKDLLKGLYKALLRFLLYREISHQKPFPDGIPKVPDTPFIADLSHHTGEPKIGW